METGINHLLNTMGILKNFCISKTISTSEIEKIKRNIKDEISSKEEYNEILKQEIVKYTTEYIKKNRIPGLVYKNNSFSKSNNSLSIYKDALDICNILKSEKKYSNNDVILLISQLINILKINIKDINKLNGNQNNNDDFDEDDPYF